MGRKIGASKRTRGIGDGTMRYDVRWRERVQGEVRQFAKSFAANADAEPFLRSSVAKTSAIRPLMPIME